MSTRLDQKRRPRRANNGQERPALRKMDPMMMARSFVRDLCVRTIDGVEQAPILLRWQGQWWLWKDGAWQHIPDDEMRAKVVQYCDRTTSDITKSAVTNILACIDAELMLPAAREMPSWIGTVPDGFDNPLHVLAARNGLFHLPSLAVKSPTARIAPTPRFFASNVLDIDVDMDAKDPEQWLEFLNQLWPSAPDCISTLQEWFGLMLVPDTRQQKILLPIGPRRSGKGTIGRVMRATVGSANVAGPTLAGLGTNFGLWPLLGKSVAIISDARLSGRTDAAIVTERLLSISGEDALTIDRKNLQPVTTKLSTRFVIFTNELPRLGDSSGALAGRMLVLPLTRSFYGHEDHDLTDKLLTELPGIVKWAVEGWARLHERGHFVQPKSGLQLLGELEDIGSPISVFVRECCIIDPLLTTDVPDLFVRWQRWCASVGYKDAGSSQLFGRDLRAAFPWVKTSQRREGEQRYRTYEGIGIKPAF